MAGDKHDPTDFGGGPVAQIGWVDIFLAKFAPTATAIPNAATDPALDLRVYPNPFNPATTITYVVPTVAAVTVRVFDAQGRLVTTLVDERRHPAERRTVTYDAAVASGVYFIRLDVGGQSISRKIVLLK
jgi:hypothetical protein